MAVLKRHQYQRGGSINGTAVRQDTTVLQIYHDNFLHFSLLNGSGKNDLKQFSVFQINFKQISRHETVSLLLNHPEHQYTSKQIYFSSLRIQGNCQTGNPNSKTHSLISEISKK